MRFKAENPYFMMITFAGRKSGNFSLQYIKENAICGLFSDTNMNFLFQRKCVNNAVESIYSWVSQHLVTTWSKFGQPNYKYSRQRYSHIFSEKVHILVSLK